MKQYRPIATYSTMEDIIDMFPCDREYLTEGFEDVRTSVFMTQSSEILSKVL